MTSDEAAEFLDQLKAFYGSSEFTRKWNGVESSALVATVCATFQGTTHAQRVICFRMIAASGTEFCPSLPTLLAWCYANEILPDYEAYHLACDGRARKDPLVYETMRRHGAFQPSRKEFMTGYAAVKAEYIGGARFAVPVKIAAPPVETQKPTEAQKERFKAYRSNLMKMVNGSGGGK